MQYYCPVCEQYRKGSELFKTGEDGKEVVCRVCSPELWYLDCIICKTSKASTDFPAAERKEKTRSWRRCWACFKCNRCGQKYADKTAFAEGSNFCRNCYNQQRTRKCGVCKQDMRLNAFSESQLRHASDRSRNKVLRCNGCHKCVTCGAIKVAKDFELAASRCHTCASAA